MSSCRTDVKENQGVFSVVGPSPAAQPVSMRKSHPLKEGANGHAPCRYRPKRRRRAAAQQKNALVLLNELRPALPFQLLARTGPVHAPHFLMSVQVDGQVFQGAGSTKKKAKLSAAEKVLSSGVPLHPLAPPPVTQPPPPATQAPPPATRAPPPATLAPSPDFTSDHTDSTDLLFQPFDAPWPHPLNGHLDLSTRNPVLTLNQLRPGLRFECVSGGGAGPQSFVVTVAVDAQRFQAYGRSKRLAKARAARAVLAKLFHLRPHPPPSSQPVPPGRQVRGSQEVPQVLADAVSRLVMEKFSELTDNLTCPLAQRKVLAGVVMTTGMDVSGAKVVCVSTGAKCIDREFLSDRGHALNDCHAEVIARRALLRFLYAQLEHFLSDDTDIESIFNRHDNGFRLKDDVHFHLYVSTAPCGDARIFSPHDGEDVRPLDTRTCGRLRSKVPSGEGTIPAVGDQLLSMSCSDKIARWNVLGLQGSLLTYFMEPVYLSSLVLGRLYHARHLHRAVYQRLAHVQELPPPFYLNQPLLSGISDTEARQAGNAPSFSVNWTLGDSELEIIDAATGRDPLGRPSRLSRHFLFRCWAHLHRQLPRPLRISAVGPCRYQQVKQGALQYQQVKHVLFRAFERAQLGSWTHKPPEMQSFTLS